MEATLTSVASRKWSQTAAADAGTVRLYRSPRCFLTASLRLSGARRITTIAPCLPIINLPPHSLIVARHADSWLKTGSTPSASSFTLWARGKASAAKETRASHTGHIMAVGVHLARGSLIYVCGPCSLSYTSRRTPTIYLSSFLAVNLFSIYLHQYQASLVTSLTTAASTNIQTLLTD